MSQSTFRNGFVSLFRMQGCSSRTSDIPRSGRSCRTRYLCSSFNVSCTSYCRTTGSELPWFSSQCQGALLFSPHYKTSQRQFWPALSCHVAACTQNVVTRPPNLNAISGQKRPPAALSSKLNASSELKQSRPATCLVLHRLAYGRRGVRKPPRELTFHTKPIILSWSGDT